MKKTLVSLATASLIVTSAMAADKGIDIVTTGQAAVYYNTAAKNGSNEQNLFGATSTDNTRGNYGIQLNLDADLKNDFTFGSQINYIGTLGLEKSIVNNVMQSTDDDTATANIADDIYLSKLFIAKKLGNTTVKLGRQELPKSLSPFAYSESWNMFKNTFEAALVVNSDIPDTTVVGAYVTAANGNGFGDNMSGFDNLTANNHAISGASVVAVTGPAYMLTVQNKSVPMTTITATYYDVSKIDSNITAADGDELEGANVVWGDVAVAGKDLPMGLKIGVQGGVITTESALLADTTAYGVKVALKPVDALSLCVAYSSVDGDDDLTNINVTNLGGVKSPLYTQMIANQGAISYDNDTFMLKGIYNAGDYGKIILMGSSTTDNTPNETNGQTDLTDIELVYKFKAVGVNFLAAYINQTWDSTTDVDAQDIVRVVARYKF